MLIAPRNNVPPPPLRSAVSPGRRVKYTYKEKEEIVYEAYMLPRMIKPTAAKYGVCPSNIRRWKEVICKIKAETTPEKWNAMKNKKCIGPGNVPLENHVYERLLTYIEQLR